MAMTKQVRLEDLLRVRDPAPNAPQRVLGVWPGNPASETRVLVNRTIDAAEKIIRGAYDVRGNRNFGPLERNERLREISSASLRELNAHATTLKAKKETLRNVIREISPVQPYEKAGHWTAPIDLRLVDAFNALPVSEKAAMKHALLDEPILNWGLAEAMLRLPLLVTGIEHAERQTIRINLFRSLHQDEYANLNEQMEQLSFAEGANRLAVEAALEILGSSGDVAEYAPTAFELAQAADSVAWGT